MVTRIRDILNVFPSCRIGVFGDFCVDRCPLPPGGEAELAGKTGKSARAGDSRHGPPGGAGNIAAGLVALGVGEVHAFGVIGDDPLGRELMRELAAIGVEHGGMVTQLSAWATPVCAEPAIGDEEQGKGASGRDCRLADETMAALAGTLRRALPGLDALIVNRRVAGGLWTKAVIDALNALANDFPACRFVLDSRAIPTRCRGMIPVIDAREAPLWCGECREIVRGFSPEDLARYAEELCRQAGKPVVITRGPRGILTRDGTGIRNIPGIQAMGPTDPAGAGDTVAAALAAALAAGADIHEAASLANLAGAVAVRKPRSADRATPDEITEEARSVAYIHNPELAEDPGRAVRLEGSRIEIVSDSIPAGSVRHAVFDHDGTISTLRQGWEGVMEPVMVRCILGDRAECVSEDTRLRVVQRVRAYIDRSTGIQTIVQMEELARMVREFAFVPAAEVLDAVGYKAIYNDALMQLVNARTDAVRKGELGIADFTIEGAPDFLRTLRRLGIRLYLASGTDRDDVHAEARLLGYADLFDGGIFGAVGDVATYSKKRVIERIIAEHRLSGTNLLCVGDGPVEIREAKRCGGIAVGVASDEVHRFGENPEKRARLIRAGADVIVPDFSQADRLLSLLGLAGT